jgi:hypothetical protein
MSGSRERRRAERRKRKRRSTERAPSSEPDSASAAGNGADPGETPDRLASRSELKNRAARETLEPLEEGERPLVVTLGAIASGLICASIVIAYAAGAEVDGEQPGIAQVLAPALLMGVMAWGMWGARYWAVLGFQVVLLFLIIAAALGLVRATGALQVVGNLLVMALAGAFFYFMVKALARIQMPDRGPRA